MFGKSFEEALGAAFIFVAGLAFTIGGLCVWGLPKLWNFLKPFIHNLTA